MAGHQRTGSQHDPAEQPGLWDLPAPAEPAEAAGPAGSVVDGGQLVEHQAVQDADERQVVERRVSRECDGCGEQIPRRRTGRPARWCSHRCRQRGYALRAAAAELGRPELAEPRVVREVIERTITRTLPAPEPEPDPEPAEPEPVSPEPAGAAAPEPVSSAVPARARDWVELLDTLTAQLDDDGAVLAREHWHHTRLAAVLERAWAALDRAHPGGLSRRR